MSEIGESWGEALPDCPNPDGLGRASARLTLSCTHKMLSFVPKMIMRSLWQTIVETRDRFKRNQGTHTYSWSSSVIESSSTKQGGVKKPYRILI